VSGIGKIFETSGKIYEGQIKGEAYHG